MKERELLAVIGGGITATFINSIARLIDTILDLGRNVGNAIQMIVSGRKC